MAERAFISSALLADHGLVGIFSLRHGGVSPPPFASLNLGHGTGDSPARVEENLKRLLHEAGLPTPHQATQVHGTGWLLCEEPGRMHPESADILIGKGGCPVSVRTADCLPILLAAPRAGIVAAVHAGWRGTVQGVATEAVLRMQALGASPNSLFACLGPCIGPCCFEVDATTASRLVASCLGADRHVRGDGHVDLAAINTMQLMQAGIPTSQIEHLAACTCCQAADYFSYRRDGEKSGRHLAIVASGCFP